MDRKLEHLDDWTHRIKTTPKPKKRLYSETEVFET